MTAQEAMDLWSSKAKRVRDELKGIIFFCGNGASATMAEHMFHDWFQNADNKSRNMIEKRIVITNEL